MGKSSRLFVVVLLPMILIAILIVMALQSSHNFSDSSLPFSVERNLQSGATDQYTVSVAAGHTLFASLLSASRNVVLSAQSANGQMLWQEPTYSFIEQAPIAQIYFISATAMGGNDSYRLTTQIDPVLTDHGSISASCKPISINNSMQKGQIDRYSVNASEGQILLVDAFNSFPGQVENVLVLEIMINGENGEALYGSPTFWMGEVPSSQRYLITLIPSSWPSASPTLNYVLSITVCTANSAKTAQRISIPDNQSSITLTDKIEPNGNLWGQNQYSLSAVRGKKLNIHMASQTSSAFTLSIRDSNNQLIISDAALMTGKNTSNLDRFSTILDSTQDYTISVIGATNTTYSMTLALK